MGRARGAAWLLILMVELGFIAWGAAAALAPDHLLGPGGKAILPAGYEGYADASWPELAASSPGAAGYMIVLYRMYGIYNLVFGFMSGAIAVTAFRHNERWAWWTLLVGNTIALVSAITYDKLVNAVGPFEMTEYVGLALVWGALALTSPLRSRNATRDADQRMRHAKDHHRKRE